MSNDFKDLKGLPPDEHIYESKKPKELKEVKNPGNNPKVNLKFSDIWNIVWGIFSDYALRKLNADHQKYGITFREILIAIGIWVILFILAVWFL